MRAITGNPAIDRLPADPGAERGQRVVLVLASIGHDITGAIENRTGRSDLRGNVPSLVLCELSLRGPLRPQDLMDVTHLTSGGMTKHLDHLEAEGLIERQFGTLRDDRRASVVSLTSDGQRAANLIGEAVESHSVELRGVIDRLREMLGD